MRKYTRADLLVIDDFASLSMDTTQAKLAFQVHFVLNNKDRCARTRRILVIANLKIMVLVTGLELEDWSQPLGTYLFPFPIEKLCEDSTVSELTEN